MNIQRHLIILIEFKSKSLPSISFSSTLLSSWASTSKRKSTKITASSETTEAWIVKFNFVIIYKILTKKSYNFTSTCTAKHLENIFHIYTACSTEASTRITAEASIHSYSEWVIRWFSKLLILKLNIKNIFWTYKII